VCTTRSNADAQAYYLPNERTPSCHRWRERRLRSQGICHQRTICYDTASASIAILSSEFCLRIFREFCLYILPVPLSPDGRAELGPVTLDVDPTLLEGPCRLLAGCWLAAVERATRGHNNVVFVLSCAEALFNTVVA
jgi:hypothetical protein